jgi:hypothetical protein
VDMTCHPAREQVMYAGRVLMVSPFPGLLPYPQRQRDLPLTCQQNDI